MPLYAIQTAPSYGWYGSNVGLIRNSIHLHISKIIVTGTYCSEIPVGSTLMPLMSKSWSQPPVWAPKRRETNSFSAPTYSLCGDQVDISELDFQFYDYDVRKPNPLSWVTFDPETGMITVAPGLNEFMTYSLMVQRTRIYATHRSRKVQNSEYVFNTKFEDPVISLCT